MTKITAEQAEFLKKIKGAPRCTVDVSAQFCIAECLLSPIKNGGCGYCPSTGQADNRIDELLAEYEQQQEVAMSEQKEIKFQDKTRGGYEYRIYTRDGRSVFPIVGEVLIDDEWYLVKWKATGIAENGVDELKYDLIPIEPAELEGLKVGEPVYAINRYGIVGRYFIKERIGDDFFSTTGMCMHIDGTHNDIGNGQKLFFRSEERALASIKKEEKNV